MARKKKTEEFEKKLEKVEFPECDGGLSRRQTQMIDLLKKLANQNEQVIQLLTQLKERFI